MSIKARNVGKMIGDPTTRILSGINLEIKDGEFLALTGRSGSGKSTLLYLLSTLDKVSEGEVEINGQKVNTMPSDALHSFRNLKMGFIFQFHYLLAELNALENVLMPARKSGREEEREDYAHTLLKQFDLDDKMHRLPRQLSGGEQQRVAIARALVMEPQYLFADEPTGSLDSVNGENVMNIIRDVNERLKVTVIMVTHEADFARLARRQVHLVDGRVQ
ncbi:MAG: ATP-binding protein [Omnitrophica WOR_2 bacterium RIFCSPHIGHO2_01_FULL_48_9]|nr:MAG: ATP-binding protein [Omnitrophica WOR_2 bacterium RIFCSPHIGHO2_01_FULL_48_9]